MVKCTPEREHYAPFQEYIWPLSQNKSRNGNEENLCKTTCRATHSSNREAFNRGSDQGDHAESKPYDNTLWEQDEEWTNKFENKSKRGKNIK